MSVAKRFADTSQDEIEKKRLKLQSDNTIKSNRKAANILKAYLTENLTMDNFENCPPEELAIVLERFYMDLRKHDGTMYKTTSFESIRSGLNRYLQSPPFNKKFDIVKDEVFKEANKNFTVGLQF